MQCTLSSFVLSRLQICVENMLVVRGTAESSGLRAAPSVGASLLAPSLRRSQRRMAREELRLEQAHSFRPLSWKWNVQTRNLDSVLMLGAHLEPKGQERSIIWKMGSWARWTGWPSKYWVEWWLTEASMRPNTVHSLSTSASAYTCIILSSELWQVVPSFPKEIWTGWETSTWGWGIMWRV